IPHEPPSDRRPSDALRRLGPVRGKTLESFGITNVRYHDVAVLGPPDRRRRGDPQPGAALQRGNVIAGPSESTIALGPVEPVGAAGLLRSPGRILVALEEDGRWVGRSRGEKEHA